MEAVDKDRPPLLLVDRISKSFDQTEDRKVLSEVSFALQSGQAIAIIGPSGSGKTTLLRCINLLTPFDSGSVLLDGEEIAEGNSSSGYRIKVRDPRYVRTRIGMVFQEYNLWPNKTVEQNISEGPHVVLGWSTLKAKDLARELCDKVGIFEKLHCYPDELSGGQRQRAAIARSLAMGPDVLMLDEVTSALDPIRTAGLLDVIEQLKDDSRGLLVVTHHLDFASAVADSLVFLWGGRTHEVGPPRDVLANPTTSELRDFVRDIRRVS